MDMGKTFCNSFLQIEILQVEGAATKNTTTQ